VPTHTETVSADQCGSNKSASPLSLRQSESDINWCFIIFPEEHASKWNSEWVSGAV